MNFGSSIQHNWESNDANRPLGVALRGVDHGLENTLRFFFIARCQNSFYLEPEGARADLVIIDFDGTKGKEYWESHSMQNPGCPAILLSQIGAAVEGAELVTKPLRVKTLQRALDNVRKHLGGQSRGMARPQSDRVPSTPQVPSPVPAAAEASKASMESEETESRVAQARVRPSNNARDAASRDPGMWLNEKWSHAFIGMTPDINARDPRQLEEAQYDPEQFLVSRLLRAYHLAKEKKCAVCLKHERGSFTVFSGDRRVLVWMPEQHVHSLAASPVDDESLSILELGIGPNSGLNPLDPQHDLDALLWKLTLIACRGRFPLGTDPHAPVVLKSWPDLTRLQAIPHASRIAALWHRTPNSLLGTAKMLDIPQRFVFAFYSATHLMGLSAAVPRRSATAPA